VASNTESSGSPCSFTMLSGFSGGQSILLQKGQCGTPMTQVFGGSWLRMLEVASLSVSLLILGVNRLETVNIGGLAVDGPVTSAVRFGKYRYRFGNEDIHLLLSGAWVGRGCCAVTVLWR